MPGATGGGAMIPSRDTSRNYDMFTVIPQGKDGQVILKNIYNPATRQVKQVRDWWKASPNDAWVELDKSTWDKLRTKNTKQNVLGNSVAVNDGSNATGTAFRPNEAQWADIAQHKSNWDDYYNQRGAYAPQAAAPSGPTPEQIADQQAKTLAKVDFKRSQQAQTNKSR